MSLTFVHLFYGFGEMVLSVANIFHIKLNFDVNVWANTVFFYLCIHRTLHMSEAQHQHRSLNFA